MITRAEFNKLYKEAYLRGDDDFVAGYYSVSTILAFREPDDVWSAVKRLNARYIALCQKSQ